MKIKEFLFLSLVVTAISCSKETPSTTNVDCTGLTPTYTNDIGPIMNASCATSGCHSAASRADGIDLSTYTKVSSFASNNSFLGSIEHLSGYKSMPQGSSKLSDTKITAIKCWINNGKPE